MHHLRLASVIILLALPSCSDGPTGVATVAGAYVATFFTYSQQGLAPTDILAAGGTLSMTLAADGTTTGQLFVPAALNGGTDLTENMAGTFSLNADTVRFSQTADTFVRDVAFIVSGRTLQGALNVGPLLVDVITVTLTRP